MYLLIVAVRYDVDVDITDTIILLLCTIIKPKNC